MSLTSELAGLFEVRDYRWRINGELVVPTEQDIKTTLDKVIERLENEPMNTSLEVGRLRIEKTQDGVEVYVWMGDYDQSS